MPENTQNNPGLVISEGIGIQRYKTVVTPANKLFKAFFKEMEKPAIPCQRCSCFAFIFTKWLLNARNVLKTNLREELKYTSRQSFLYIEYFFQKYWKTVESLAFRQIGSCSTIYRKLRNKKLIVQKNIYVPFCLKQRINYTIWLR